MYCSQCGINNKGDARFCTGCGSDLTKQTPPEKKYGHDSIDDSETTLGQDISSDSLERGSLFANRYEILDEGKRGGMGAVYKCKDTELNEIAAVKIIHPRLLNSTNALSRFRQEVAISRKLHHKNIVEVHDIAEESGIKYFTMEWVEGVTLREVIEQRKKDNKPFTLEEAHRIISQLADALQYAHKYTIHRDIKPENILVEGFSSQQSAVIEGTKIKLTDFGIAKMLSPSEFTSTSIQMGTPYYMAPEQKVDAATVDKRADIYAMGVMLFELLTLENTIGPEMPSEFNGELPIEIDSIYRKSVATRPENRYGESKELSDAVSKVVQLLSDRTAEAERKAKEELKKADEKKKQHEESERRKREEDERHQREAEGRKKQEEKQKEEAEKKRSEEEKQREEERKRAEAEESRRKGQEQRTKEKEQKNYTFIYILIVIAVIGGIAYFMIKNIDSQPAKLPVTQAKPAQTVQPTIERTQKKSSDEGMVYVKGGCYQMGDTFGDGESNEKPVHEVCVDDFYIGKYEVTQGQWKEVMGSNPSHFKNCGDNCPVEKVSWNDAQEFLKRLNSNPPFNKGGQGGFYRLPTEAEWEYAARSGGKKEKWAGTSSESALGEYAWHSKGNRTYPVGQKRPNGLGLYDMSGNVWEWVSDWYDYDYYKNSPRDNPQGPSGGSYRVDRGGSWYNVTRYVRCAFRNSYTPSDRGSFIGFRLARTK